MLEGKDSCARERAHVGFMLVIFSPDLDLTNSLFIKRPIGCLYSRPLGALRLRKRSEVISCQRLKGIPVGCNDGRNEGKRKENQKCVIREKKQSRERLRSTYPTPRGYLIIDYISLFDTIRYQGNRY